MRRKRWNGRRVVVFVAALSTAASVLALVPAGAAGPEGTLDPAFSGDGKVLTSFKTNRSIADAVALQPDGKIVAAGHYSNGTDDDFAVARYNTDGSLDPTFSGDGLAKTPVGVGDDDAAGVAIQSDGKIVVVGGATVNAARAIAVVRYNPNGTLDTSFDGDGKTTTDIGPAGDEATSVVIQPDGKIVIGGLSDAGGASGDDFAVVRYNPNGSLDNTFSGDGKTTTPVGTGSDELWALALQPDGRIVTVGQSISGGDTQFTVVRFTAGGVLDSTFSGDGKTQTVTGPGFAAARGVAIQTDGKIVVAGNSTLGGKAEFTLVRYNADGSVDGTLNGSGVVNTSIGAGDAQANAVAIQPDGKIVAAGFALAGGGVVIFAVARYQPDGSRDHDFAGGSVTTQLQAQEDVASAVAIGPGGKIVAAGYSRAGSTFQFGLTRFIGDATPPFGAHLAGPPMFSTVLTRTLEWNASDDNTGVRTFDVRRRGAAYNATTYGTYSAFTSGNPHTFGSFTGVAGHTYCFGVRAHDTAGNAGLYSPDQCIAFPVDERTMTRTGSWTASANSVFYDSTALVSKTAGAALTLPVAYRHLALVVTRCTTCGVVKVFLGNTLLATVNLHAASTQHRVVVNVSTSVGIKTGTVKITQASNGKNVHIEGLAVSLA